MDGMVALVTGSVTSLPGFGLYLGAIINGGYTIYNSISSGNSIGTSLLAGGLSAASSLCTLSVLPQSLALKEHLI